MNIAILVDVAALLREGSFAVEGAALACNELAGLLLRHVFVAAGDWNLG